ncbi:MAG: hypothetical protein H6754_06470 [Candidatus Omnitrophica bacterium]|nr:hypothetical protein [Candidatus Omnitrophota bacterium]
MENNLTIKGRENGQLNSNEVLKLTSLIYLKEALLAQRYEDCAELIRDAKGFGAEQVEISALLVEVFRGRKTDADSEAKQINEGRSRF